VFALAACGSSESGSLELGAEESSVPEAVAADMTDAAPIPNGIYNVVGPLCSTTERTPPYDSLEKPVIVRDFNFLLTRTIEIADDRWIEVYEDDDCRLTITGGIALNERGVYQETGERVHIWKPDSCMFTASYTSPEESAS